MRLDAGQHLRLSQQQRLAPRMIQSMEILQLSSQALEERIEQELTNNPTLEVVDPAAAEEGADSRQQQEQEQRDATEGERELAISDDSVDAGHADDFERLSNLSEEVGEAWGNTYESESYRELDGYRAPVNRDSGDRDAKLDAMANTVARPTCLTDQLLDQWRLLETSPAIRAAGEYLISFIDADGYLRTERQMLIDQMPAGMSQQHLDEALELIQRTLEPVGIGARDLRECLLLQIDFRLRQEDAAERNGSESRELLQLVRTLVQDHVRDIEANRLPKIAAALNIPVEQIKQALTLLKQFHPRPGRMLVEDLPQVIRPDAIIEYDDVEDRYSIRLTNDRLPQLQISPVYQTMASDKQVDRKTREFVGNNLRNARWILEAIQQRHHTLLRVIQVVVEAQREFFDHGLQHLKPLPMTGVADQLGIHVATVSRAVNEKYVQTPRGIFPLRMFFSGGTETEAGDSMSWAAVQAKLEQVIAQEDKSNPLSDDQLVEKLKAEGIEIARRTVAKYRKQLNIAPARQRKQF